jgi:hypothetical protein
MELDGGTRRSARALTAILAKHPEPGTVKTRLVPALSPADAARLALAMLDDAVARSLHPAAASRARLCFAPEDARSWFEARYGARIELRPQRGADLGERLAQAFAEGLAEPGVAGMVALGSDAPRFGAARIAEAHERLRAGADLVLGPDQGGGYYLVGLRAPAPALFREVRMSTPTMCRETIARARDHGMRVELCEPEQDVDTAADLHRLFAELKSESPELLRATLAVVASLHPRPR